MGLMQVHRLGGLVPPWEMEDARLPTGLVNLGADCCMRDTQPIKASSMGNRMEGSSESKKSLHSPLRPQSILCSLAPMATCSPST